MKTFKIILKILVALAAIAGVVYVIATYGEKIAQWCKDMLNRLSSKFGCKEEDFCDAPSEENAVEEAASDAVVAEEADFEG